MSENAVLIRVSKLARAVLAFLLGGGRPRPGPYRSPFSWRRLLGPLARFFDGPPRPRR